MNVHVYDCILWCLHLLDICCTSKKMRRLTSLSENEPMHMNDIANKNGFASDFLMPMLLWFCWLHRFQVWAIKAPAGGSPQREDTWRLWRRGSRRGHADGKAGGAKCDLRLWVTAGVKLQLPVDYTICIHLCDIAKKKSCVTPIQHLGDMVCDRWLV